MAKVAIAKRRAKRLAAGSVTYVSDLSSWMQSLYTVVNGVAVPFGLQMYPSEADAIAETNQTLKTDASDWADVPDDAVEGYIAEHTRNRWSA